MTAPLVAVPTYHLVAGRVAKWTAGGYGVPETYIDGLARAGLAAVLLPAVVPAGASAGGVDVLDGVSGLLLVGGGDVEPARYGAAPHPANYGMEPDRDAQELALVREAVRRRLPVLAVCRGMQLLNVAMGGTLHQHLPDLRGSVAHGVPAGGAPASHDVRVAPGTRLADVAGGAAVLPSCTSVHHQGVDRLGDGLIATGWSDDGLVEALETPAGDGWVLAVQWHPEMSAATDPGQQAVFDAFAAAAVAAGAADGQAGRAVRTV